MRTRSGATSWGTAVIVAVALVTLAGCGDETSSGADSGATDPASSGSPGSSSSAGSADPTEPAGDVCPYLTAEQVSAVTGTPTSETAGSVHACFFDPDGGKGPSVMLSRVNIEIDPTDYAVQSRALCQGEVTDVDAGDEAFACVMGLGPQGQLYVDRVLISVNVNDATDDAVGIADAAQLLGEVTIPESTD